MEQEKEHENGSNSEAVSPNSNLDQMSNQEMRTELQRLGIQTCESTRKEFLQPLLKLALELKEKPSNTQSSSAAAVDNDFEAFYCPICIGEYSPTELLKTPRNLECGHSFCTSCLIQSRCQQLHNASITYGIKCPTCRSVTLAPTKDDVKTLPKNFTAIAMLQSTKRQSIEAISTASKRRRFDSTEALANAVRICELLEGRPQVSKDPAKAFQMAEEGSQAGCIHSMGILGRCYITGSGVEVDEHHGLQLGRESAVAGSAYGEFVVAFAYESGLGDVEKDLKEAVEHYKVAVLLDMAEAQYRLASIYLKHYLRNFGDDKNIPVSQVMIKNSAEASKLLRLASEQGHADSQIALAIKLCDNYGASDYLLPNNEALRLFKLALKQGSAGRHLEGLHGIAGLYKHLGDDVEAFNHHKLASDQGHSDSSFRLAEMHQHGEGVNQDVEEAISIYKRLIEKGVDGSFAAIRDLYLEDGDNAEALKWCKRGADEGDDLGLVHAVARMYEGWDPRDPNYERLNVAMEGDGIERDFVEAAKYYKLACELFPNDIEVADSAYELAKMYEEGRGVAQNYEVAVRFLNIGVGKYHEDSKFHLACMYEEGRGVAQNLDKAAALFKELTEDEHCLDQRAFCRLASMYRNGRGVPQNKHKALTLLDHECLDNNADASFLHASMLLENATGSSKDSEIELEATRLLELAASQSHADAQYLLACQLEGGSLKRKIELLKGASKSNNMNATFKLACMLADGEGVARDDKEAAKLLMAAVSKGHVESHCRLADMFEHGKGVAQSMEVAAMLYGQAAEKNNASALCNLARMHKHGHGVMQSQSEAFKFCRLAAVQGFAQAKYDLACMYLEGVGTAVVRSEAIRWLHEAAAQGHQEAASALRRLKVVDAGIALTESQSQSACPGGITANCSVL